MTRQLGLILFSVMFWTYSATALQDSITSGEIETSDGTEFVTIVRPTSPDFTVSYPILFSPGSRDYPEPTFFWGDEPSNLGWLIVQTEQLYRGGPEDLKRVMDAAMAKLRQEGFQIADVHLIGWSASSGAAARHAAAMGAEIRSVSFIPGYGGGRSVERMCAHKNLRVNFITGSKDGSWLRGAEGMRDKLLSCGNQHVAFHVIEDGGHVLREISGEPLFNVLNAARPNAH
ncbi:MAG: hypothetical protein JJ850_01155 [Kordiimonadaceae bacterium]|nr:hypothetical protein [Kordiimonadaceae bacterium]MBO6567591.1 hypothetical protein [Kordiimonadaceae bacterium]MBO6963195.1 hypothetical protein [Kordiimonadaceae bacterium]